MVSGQKQSPKLIAKIEKVIGLPLWTAPEAKVPVTVGPSGLQMIVSAVEAVLLESRLATLREINPDGNFSISGMQSAIAINDRALLDRLVSHSNREGVTADEHHAEASATFSRSEIPSDLGAAQKDYLPGEAPLPASSPGQPPPLFH
ncbi:hypothetical protein DB345_17310 [Spartobacteria bacterium LR76]|nr:hypothetical protein DB345_17310 [Spartobacteria bacterium LR76]